jgi:hypothetical protein
LFSYELIVTVASCGINSEIFLSDMVLELNLIAVKGVQQESLVDLL